MTIRTGVADVSSRTSDASVSVLVPTFNRSRMLSECLASLLEQSVRPLEILVVDDGSSDDTAAVVARFAPAVRYFRKANAGKAAALNFVLPEARGQWLWFFDDDDVALPAALESRLQRIRESPAADLVVSPFVWGSSDATGRIASGAPLRWPRLDAAGFYVSILRGCCAHLSGMLVRRERAIAAGPFREDLAASEDYEFTLRIARGAKVAICQEPSFIFRQHGGERGQAAGRYAASDRLRRFAEGDAEIGRWIRRTHELAEYLGLPRDAELDDQHRADALLVRLAVMAGKGLFEEVARDCADLASLADAAARSATIGRAVRAAMQEDYLVLRLASAPAVAAACFSALGDLAEGRALLRFAARGLLARASWPRTALSHRLALLNVAAWLAAFSVGVNPVKSRLPQGV